MNLNQAIDLLRLVVEKHLVYLFLILNELRFYPLK